MVNAISKLHKNLYIIGKKLPKRDRFGIHGNAENISLEILKLAIEAALAAKSEKRPILKHLRIEVEVMQHLVRAEQELNIINAKTYFELARTLQEISKMAAGWLRYIEKEELA